MCGPDGGVVVDGAAAEHLLGQEVKIDYFATSLPTMLLFNDDLQQRHAVTAFPYAVIKKYGDDQGGNLAALLTYYGFLSLFPLLLVFYTVLGYVLQGHPDWQDSLRTSALADFPIIGSQISRNVTS